MSLRNDQSEFVWAVGELIRYAYRKGFELTFGDTYPYRKHCKNSFHNKGLAIDLNLFKNGKYLTKTEDHEVLGLFWEALGEKFTWGGRWKDGNHYSYGEGGRKVEVA